MIYVTHDQVEAMTLGDRIVVMKDGVIQQVAAPLELYHKPVNKFVAGFIGSPPMNMVDGELYADGVVQQVGSPLALYHRPMGSEINLYLDIGGHSITARIVCAQCGDEQGALL
jgi:multiple sugar transport system ATP-binding protein